MGADVGSGVVSRLRLSVKLAEHFVHDIDDRLRLDAWSIVDSAHRFRDLVQDLPGLGHSTWKRLIRDRTQDIADLRDMVQHQTGSQRQGKKNAIKQILQCGGQLWGYLSWAEFRDGFYTGKWLTMSAGSDCVGDEWFFIGPLRLPISVPAGRIRLNAFGRQVYLGHTVMSIAEAVRMLEDEIRDNRMRPMDIPATNRRGADVIDEGYMEVISANATPTVAGPLRTEI
jgi:hypothetical protein